MCICRCVFLCLCDYYILHTLEDGWHVPVWDSQLSEWESQRRRGRWMGNHTEGTTNEQRAVKMWGFLWCIVWWCVYCGIWQMWPRQVLWSQSQTEWETEAVWKIDVPYLQQLSREEGDVKFWKWAYHGFFFFSFFLCALHHTNLFLGVGVCL